MKNNKKTADRLGLSKALEQVFEEINATLTARLDTMPDPESAEVWNRRIKEAVISIPMSVNHEEKLTKLKKVAGLAAGAIMDLYRESMYKSLDIKTLQAPEPADKS